LPGRKYRQPSREQTFADIDQDYTECEYQALGPQGIGAAGIAAAKRTDIDAAQFTQTQATGHRAEQVRRDNQQPNHQTGSMATGW
jgi:hypothetical protein